MPFFKRIGKLFTRKKREPEVEMPANVRKQVELLKDADAKVRRNAVWMLGCTKHESAIPILLKTLQHPSEDMRQEAASALGVIGQESVIPHLVQALQRDKVPNVRWSAAWALGKIGHESAIPHLVKAFQDQNESVRTNATWAFEQIGHSLKGKTVKGKEAKALQLVGPLFHKMEELTTMRKAYEAALEGRVTEKNARLFVKELRAVKGNLK